MGLNVRIYNIVYDNTYSLRYKSGDYPYPENIDSTFTLYGTGLTNSTITLSGLSFDTQYWIKMTDDSSGRYIIKNIYIHDSKAYPCYDTLCFDVEEVCLSPTPSITPTITVTPSITPSFTPTVSVTPTISVTPSITPSFTPTTSVTPTTTPTPSPTSCACSSYSVTNNEETSTTVGHTSCTTGQATSVVIGAGLTSAFCSCSLPESIPPFRNIIIQLNGACGGGS